MPSPPAANVEAQLAGSRIQPALERTQHGGRHSGGMPIHPHHAAERLKPEWIAQASQQLPYSALKNDGFRNGRAQFGHPVGKPSRNVSTMQWRVGSAGALHTLYNHFTALLLFLPLDPVPALSGTGLTQRRAIQPRAELRSVTPRQDYPVFTRFC